MANSERRKNIFNDIWQVMKKHENPDMSDGYWDSVIKDMENVIAKHNSDKLAVGFAQLVLADLEREAKGEI